MKPRNIHFTTNAFESDDLVHPNILNNLNNKDVVDPKSFETPEIIENLKTQNFKHMEKVLAKFGNTQVLCSVYIQFGAKYVPEHAKQKQQGWLTAEYQMLPNASPERQKREKQPAGRTQEIQRLIGRTLRAALDLKALPDVHITVDCDVLYADGGTRTTAINGAFLALYLAWYKILGDLAAVKKLIPQHVGAISVGLLADDVLILDLNYEQDHQALVDANIILASAHVNDLDDNSTKIVEIQAAAEGQTFSFTQLKAMYDMAYIGIGHIKAAQDLAFNQCFKF